MGWAKDAFERELANSYIFPVNMDTSPTYTPTYPRKKKPRIAYFQYDFPTEAQVRALNFISTYTGIIFEGTTKGEARNFISEHLDYVKEEKNNGEQE